MKINPGFMSVLMMLMLSASLRAEAWNLSSASYKSNCISISSQDTDAKLLFFRPDGECLFMIGDISDRLHQYELSLPWDINSAQYANISYDFSSEVTDPKGLFFKPDGTKLYLNDCLTDHVYQYTLSVPWDITSITYDGISYNYFDQVTNAKSLFFKPDGTRFYIDCYVADRIFQFDLAIPWDVSSAVYNEESFYFHDIEDEPQQVSFRQDGLLMFLNGSGGDSIYRFSLSTAWDVTTASYDNLSFNFMVHLNEHATRGHFFSPDGRLIYVIGQARGKISQLTLDEPWNPERIFFENNFSIISQDGDMQNVFFSPDGLRMFLLGYSFNRIFQYDLSLPWDVRSAIYNNVFLNFGALETNPRGMHFKPDGSSLYLIGSQNDFIYQYDLTIPWDIAAAEVSESYYAGTLEPNSRSLALNPDGSKLYLCGATHRIYQYSLPVPWQISSAVYDGVNFSVTGQTYNERGIFFKPDGTGLFLTSSSNNLIYQYDLLTPWDITSTVYTDICFCVNSLEGNARDVFFDPPGEKMFLIGAGADKVIQFSLCDNAPPVNFPPVIDLPASISFLEDESITLDFSEFLFDPEGDSLTLCAENAENIISVIDGFIVTLSATENWNGCASVCFCVNDGQQRSTACDDVMIEVIAVNDPPWLNLPSHLDLLEDETLSLPLSSFCGDIDGDTLLLNITGNQYIETFTDSLALTLIPSANWFGSEILLFTVSDEGSRCSISDSLLLNVFPVNDPPWLNLPDSLQFSADSSLEVDFAPLCGDIDCDTLSLAVSGGEHIVAEISELLVTFCSLDCWLGCECFSFTISDAEASAEDQVFLLSSPSGKPQIVSITDRPSDQGGFVYLSFSKSYYDTVLPQRSTEFYTVWHQQDGIWIALSSLGALGEDLYTVLAPTFADSTASDPAVTNFRVSAHLDEGTWISLPDSGYSVDNLPPEMPEGLFLQDNLLLWQNSSAADLACYSLFRDSLLVAYSLENFYNLENLYGFWQLTACDVHDNASPLTPPVIYLPQPGDVDGNGNIEAFDAALVLQYFVLFEPEGFPLPWAVWRFEAADVDDSGNLEAYDAALILRISLNLLRSLAD